MNILYLGDIVGEPGIQIVQDALPDIIDKHDVDVVIAQSENVSDGKSMTVKDMKRLTAAGVDVFSGGNHTVERKTLWPLLKDDQSPVLAPANMDLNPGSGVYVLEHHENRVVVISLLGTMFGKASIAMQNPFIVIDDLLASLPKLPSAIVVNIHAEYSSEKLVMAQFLDGRVSLVVGDHWHVPTADARILPNGTAAITDVGMCGTIDSSLGVKTESIIERFKDGVKNRNEIELNGPRQLCCILVDLNSSTGLARKVTQILHKN